MKSFVISGKKNACINKLLLKFGLSNIVGWVVYFIGYFADSLIGGNQLGEEALAAIEIVFPIYSFIYFVSTLLGLGCVIYKSIQIGKNDFKKANRIFSTGFYGSIFLGIIMSLFLWLIRDPFLSLYKLSDTTLEYAKSYYNPYIFLALFMPLIVLIYDAASYDGSIILTVASDICVSFSNIVVSSILINKMGISGLSIATLICNTIPYSLCIIHFLGKTNTSHLKWTFSFNDVLHSIKFGSSKALSYFVLSVGDILLNAFICHKFGSNYAAPYSVINFILEISAAMLFVGDSMNTLMCISFGENNISDVKAELRRSLLYAVIIPAFFTLIMVVLGLTGGLNYLFGIETPEFKNYVILAALTLAPTYILTGLYKVVEYYKMASGHVIPPLIINLLQSFVFQISIPIILSLIFGYNGFVVGFAVSELITFLTVYGFFFIKNKGKVFNYKEPECEFSIDLNLDKDSIVGARAKMMDELSEVGIHETVVNRMSVTIEEALLIILSHAKKRKVNARLVVNYEGEYISIIEKDNGVPFDLTNPDQKVENLNVYVYATMSESASKTSTYKSASLNTNRFIFSKDPNFDYSHAVYESI